jgi:hypothetical protein
VQVAQGSAAEAADHREAHGQPRGRRHKHQKLHHPHLGQGAEAGFGHQVLLVGVGQKRQGRVQGQGRGQTAEAQGVEPGGLEQQQQQAHQAEEGVADQQRQQIVES